MMEKNRVEAFSDGVFAIAMTLLILEIKVPQAAPTVSNREMAHLLVNLWPSFFAFLVSFATILVMWINHHGLLNLFHKVDAPFLYANGFLLLMVTFIPFPTALLAAHLNSPAAKMMGMAYGGTFVLACGGYNALLYTGRLRGLLVNDVPPEHLSKLKRAYQIGFISYVTATLLILVNALAGLMVCSLLWITWLKLDYAHNRS